MDIKTKVVINSAGWFWPGNDGYGDYEGPTSCWHYMQTHPAVPKYISAYVPNRRVVVQAGGNAGFYVKQYANLFDVVYTFEPEPVNFYCLTKNVTEINVIKFQACLGNTRGCVGLDQITPDTGSTHVQGVGLIPTFQVDDLFLQVCDLIHLDVEGYELFALEGAVNTIKTHRPVIALEYHDAWAKRYEVNYNKILTFLSSMGYRDSKKNVDGDKVYIHESMRLDR